MVENDANDNPHYKCAFDTQVCFFILSLYKLIYTY